MNNQKMSFAELENVVGGTAAQTEQIYNMYLNLGVRQGINYTQLVMSYGTDHAGAVRAALTQEFFHDGNVNVVTDNYFDNSYILGNQSYTHEQVVAALNYRHRCA